MGGLPMVLSNAAHVSPQRRLSLRAAQDIRRHGLDHRSRLYYSQHRRRCRTLVNADEGLRAELPELPGFEALSGTELTSCSDGSSSPSPLAARSNGIQPPAAPGLAAAAAVPAASRKGAEEQPLSPPQHPPQGGQQQQPQQPLPDVPPPWGLNTTITLMVVWLLVFWLLAYTVVPIMLDLFGLDSTSTAPPQVQALRHFLLDVMQLGLTVLVLRQGLRDFRPRSLGFFSLSLRPWRAWLAPLAAGVATFPAIDWVHKQLVTLLAADDYLLGGTVEQIASASDWAAHALWFTVLVVCAPVWEELMFRGFLLPSLTRCMPRWGAVAVSAAVFSAVHFTREGALPLLLLGLVFGAVYLRTRNLWPPILLHSLWNVWLLVQIRA